MGDESFADYVKGKEAKNEAREREIAEERVARREKLGQKAFPEPALETVDND